jgi:type III pantothenate kinase
MLLCIDCGNTNTVFSVWDGSRFIGTWRIATQHQRTADEYFVWLSTLIDAAKLDVRMTEAIISSTVPRVVFNLRVLCAAILIAARWWWGGPTARCRWPPVSIRARQSGLTGW